MVSPVSLRPKGMEPQGDKASDKAAKERLKERVRDLALLESPEGQRVVALVQRQLLARIEALIAADAEARAYAALLAEIGIKTNLANMALEQLSERYLGAAAGRIKNL